MRIYVLCDLEGVSGLTAREQAWFWEASSTAQAHAEARRLITDELNAAVTTALRAGADNVVARDCHHGGGNVLPSDLVSDPRVAYEAKRFPWQIAPGLDESFDGLILLGHHAKAGTNDSFLPHTWSTHWLDFRINGLSVGEIGIEACYAAHWNVPVILVQGDEACCAEAAALLAGVVTAPVKRAQSFDRAAGLDAEGGRALTGERIAEAMRKAAARQLEPFQVRLPMTVQILMRTAQSAESAAQRPGVRRLDPRTVEAQVERQCDVLKWIVEQV